MLGVCCGDENRVLLGGFKLEPLDEFGQNNLPIVSVVVGNGGGLLPDSSVLDVSCLRLQNVSIVKGHIFVCEQVRSRNVSIYARP